MSDDNSQKILEEIKGINKRLDGIDKRLDGIDSRLDGIDTRLDGIDTRLDNCATKDDVKQLNVRFDALEEKVEKMNGSVMHMEYDLNTKVQILLEAYSDSRYNYDKLRIDVAHLHESNEMHTMQIDYLKGKCNAY
ncbi:MAG: hypothetical protein FWC53_02950 [Firmicutes bacterium]|nr:hypothetical protein [Bacillota bacterium]